MNVKKSKVSTSALMSDVVAYRTQSRVISQYTLAHIMY